MQGILEPAGRSVLDEFLKRDTLLAFDYDGTLAPIVSDPARAEMRPETRERLRLAAMRYPMVVITGRRRLDVQRFLQGISILEVVGNHGAEVYGAEPSVSVLCVSEWKRQLEETLSELEGVLVEDKRYSVAIHYRNAKDQDQALSVIKTAAGHLAGAKLVEGKLVLNVVPKGLPNKGSALLSLCSRFGAPRCIFVGDDITDEDVFSMDKADMILGIKVGASNMSSARFFIKEQADIDRLLEVVLAAAAPQKSPAQRPSRG